MAPGLAWALSVSFYLPLSTVLDVADHSGMSLHTWSGFNAGTCLFYLYFPLLTALNVTGKRSIARILLNGCYVRARTPKDIYYKRYAFSKSLGVSFVATSAIVDRFSSVLYPHHDCNNQGKRS